MTTLGKGKHAYNLAASFLRGIPDSHVQNVIALWIKYFRSKSKRSLMLLKKIASSEDELLCYEFIWCQQKFGHGN